MIGNISAEHLRLALLIFFSPAPTGSKFFVHCVLTINLVRFELCHQVPVHLHQRLFGFFILIQHQLGSDGADNLGRLLHHNHLQNKEEPKRLF